MRCKNARMRRQHSAGCVFVPRTPNVIENFIPGFGKMIQFISSKIDELQTRRQISESCRTNQRVAVHRCPWVEHRCHGCQTMRLCWRICVEKEQLRYCNFRSIRYQKKPETTNNGNKSILVLAFHLDYKQLTWDDWETLYWDQHSWWSLFD